MSTDENAVPVEGEAGAVGADLSQLDSAPGPLNSVEFASRTAVDLAEAAVENGALESADFAGGGTGAGGFWTAADVRRLISAKVDAKEAAFAREVEPGPEHPPAA